MAVARERIERGASVRVPMSYEEWRALGETKHHEWSEGVLYVNRPSRWHVVVATELLMTIHAVLPPGLRVYPDWGLHTPLGDFEPDSWLLPTTSPTSPTPPSRRRSSSKSPHPRRA